MDIEEKQQPEVIKPVRGEEEIEEIGVGEGEEIEEVDMGEEEEIEEEIADVEEEEEELLGGEEEEEIDDEEEIKETLKEEYRKYRQENKWLEVLEQETDENAKELISCPYCRERYGLERVKEIVKRLRDFYDRFVEVVKNTNTVLLTFADYPGTIEHFDRPHEAVLWLANACIGLDDSIRLLPEIAKLLKEIVITALTEVIGTEIGKRVSEEEIEEQVERVIIITMPEVNDIEEDDYMDSEGKYGMCVDVYVDVFKYIDLLEKLYIN